MQSGKDDKLTACDQNSRDDKQEHTWFKKKKKGYKLWLSESQ